VRGDVGVVVEVGREDGGRVDDAECHLVFVEILPLEGGVGMDDGFSFWVVGGDETLERREV